MKRWSCEYKDGIVDGPRLAFVSIIGIFVSVVIPHHFVTHVTLDPKITAFITTPRMIRFMFFVAPHLAVVTLVFVHGRYVLVVLLVHIT